MMEQAMAQRNRAYSRAGLSLTYPNAAGIDVGSASHYVAVPSDRDQQPVRELPSFKAVPFSRSKAVIACSSRLERSGRCPRRATLRGYPQTGVAPKAASGLL